MHEALLFSAAEAVRAAQVLTRPSTLLFLEQVSVQLASCFRRGGKALIAGNGGSLCDAMHFAEELTGQFRSSRPALAALALSDAAHMSCVGNDYGFESVFARGVEALGREDDILILLTTSGNSLNILNAALMAKQKKMYTIAFMGKSGGKLKDVCDLEWIVDGFAFSDRIQEAHMAALHILVEMVEKQLFCSELKAHELLLGV